MILHLDKAIADVWSKDGAFNRAQQQHGEIFREKEGRRTVRFALNGKHYFLKLHEGVGWGEILKNLLQFRLPVIGATNEWLAIKKLHRLGLPTMTAVGYGRRGFNPAKQLSFLITDELTDTLSLEDLCATWPQRPPDFNLKQALIRQVAEIARTLHENGVNHRDFYLCHFRADLSMGRENLNPENLRLYVIDLHRAQIRKKTPLRWVVKDLGGVYFSALNIGLTSRDLLRFMAFYRRKNLRELKADSRFWLKVERRAKRIAGRDFGHIPAMPSISTSYPVQHIRK